MVDKIKLVECPRDAMQGWKTPIPTAKKIEYIHALLQVGFDTIDFGSFVSPKAIPQMADTKEVIGALSSMAENKSASDTRLLAIVANKRGAEEASDFPAITHLGFPFSVSETFQQRNTNSSIGESVKRVDEILNVCSASGKELVIYISMGFGNPYGDPYNEEIVFKWVNEMVARGIGIISLADTVGLASPDLVYSVTACMVDAFPLTEIGVHLHSRPENWREKLEAALKAGCYRFDGAIRGIGGCPMANDDLVGNMNTELMVDYFEEKDLLQRLDRKALNQSIRIAGEIFT